MLRKILININKTNILNTNKYIVCLSNNFATALRSKKPKSQREENQYFRDSKRVKVIGGKGGDGCISFLALWCNERAGPDGGDGGHGGHVIFQASSDIRNLNHVDTNLKGEPGEKGGSKDCHGKNANHNIIKVPLGTIVKNENGKIVADLDEENIMFIAGRGGSGGKGNHFFTSERTQAPEICEYGALGDEMSYQLELRSIADIGFIGFPNAGKSTLLQAISRARPKVAPYPFTTLRPHIGIIQYNDYEQISVADLPGLIPDSHKNKGLGIQFLKHAERCSILIFVIDASDDEPWNHFNILTHELKEFSPKLIERPQIIVANKIDLPNAMENLKILKEIVNVPVFEISAKIGTNIRVLLNEIKILVDKNKQIKNRQ